MSEQARVMDVPANIQAIEKYTLVCYPMSLFCFPWYSVGFDGHQQPPEVATAENGTTVSDMPNVSEPESKRFVYRFFCLTVNIVSTGMDRMISWLRVSPSQVESVCIGQREVRPWS